MKNKELEETKLAYVLALGGWSFASVFGLMIMQMLLHDLGYVPLFYKIVLIGVGCLYYIMVRSIIRFLRRPKTP